MIRLRRPSWFAMALTLAGMAIFVRLGVWQLHRADYKEQLLRRFATASSAPLHDFASVQSGAPADSDPHLRVRGRFLADRYYLVDDQIHADRVGTLVYAPFQPQGEQRLLLVDLGFLAHPGENERQPRLPPLPAGATTLTGLYAPAPATGLRLGGNALAKQSQWPKTAVYLDLDQVAADLRAPLYPRVLLLDPDPATPYLRQWTPATMPPARHRGYAFQWFSFALAALAIFVILHRRRDPKTDTDRKHDNDHE
ncbi:MAG TPA: SURF1 family protein [Rhodanobacteraceae bacterium]|nr:SURF1 family protein [Rhodanobacteraceae bacterium]